MLPFNGSCQCVLRVHRSVRRGPGDFLRGILGRYPYRCWDCGRRFYKAQRYAGVPPSAPHTFPLPGVVAGSQNMTSVREVNRQGQGNNQVQTVIKWWVRRVLTILPVKRSSMRE